MGRGKCKSNARNLKQETAGACPAVIVREVMGQTSHSYPLEIFIQLEKR